MRRGSGVAIALVLLAMGAGVTRAKTRSRALDPEAMAALERMGKFLREQSSMRIDAEMTTDDVLASGQKVQHAATARLLVRRPDRLRADVIGDRRQEQLFYDGKAFWVFQPRLGHYARFDAPPTLAQLVDVAKQRYGLDLPLADLFSWGVDPRGSELRAATRVGASSVRGVACDHYAFRQAELDWEICIESGARPLPRKLVITTTSDRAQPQHTVVMSWDLSPPLDDRDFTFTPPPSAQLTTFESAKPERASLRVGGAGFRQAVAP
jgi:hypothetical protein